MAIANEQEFFANSPGLREELDAHGDRRPDGFEMWPDPSGLMPADPPEWPSLIRWTSPKWELYLRRHQGMTWAAANEGTGHPDQGLSMIWFRHLRYRYGRGLASKPIANLEAVKRLPGYAKAANTPDAQMDLVQDLLREIMKKGANILTSALQMKLDDLDAMGEMSVAELGKLAKLIDDVRKTHDAISAGPKHSKPAAITGGDRMVFSRIDRVEISDAAAQVSGLRELLTSFRGRTSAIRPADESIETLAN